MTLNSVESSPMKTQIDELKAFLKGQGVAVDTLCIIGIGGGETFLGELAGTDSNGTLRLWNPKRIIRLQQMAQGGVQVSIMIGDLELLEGNGTHMYVKEKTFSLVSLQNEISQLNVLNLYKSYFDRKAMNDARAAGIHIPNPTLVRPT